MAVVCYFTQRMTDDSAWRIPFGLIMVIPSTVAACVWFIPESPRWLLSKGRPAEAKRALARLRRDNSDEAIDAELALMQAGLDAEQNKGTYADLVKGTNRKSLTLKPRPSPP